MSDPRIQGLIDSINTYAVDPETADFYMKNIACSMFAINGKDVYSCEADRNKLIYKDFLSDKKLHSSYDNFEDHIDEIWEYYLVRRYYNAILETGAIPVGKITANSDYAIVVDSIDGAVDKYDLEHCLHFNYNLRESDIKACNIPEEILESAKWDLYVEYLNSVLNAIEQAKNKRKDNSPVGILWESQLNSFLMKHTSIGGVVAKPIIGPHGSVRRTLPEVEWQWQAMLDVISEMSSRWPSRIINTQTKTYGKIEDTFYQNNREMGYANIDEFFDAFGYMADDSILSEPEIINEIPATKEVSTILSGKTFSAAGFSEKDEAEIAKLVEVNGGKYLFNFSSELDYLIKADSENEPIKVKKANLLVKKGKSISFITIEEFNEMIGKKTLMSTSNQ